MLTSLYLLLAAGQASLDPAAVVRRSDEILRQANTISGRLVVSDGVGLGESRFFLEKPNLLSIVSDSRRDIFDGATRTVVDLNAKTFEVRPRTTFGNPYLIGFEAFLGEPAPGQPKLVSPPAFSEPRAVEVGGATVVRRRATRGGETMTVDLDPTTALPVAWSWTRADGSYRTQIRDVAINVPIPSGTFTTNTGGMTETKTPEEKALLAAATTAPEIASRSLDGKDASLAQIAAGNSRTIVLFLDPSQPESANALVDALSLRKGRSLEVVVVTADADASRTRRFLSNCRARTVTFAGAAGATARSAYRAPLSPTTYILDEKMTIRGVWLGYDPTAVRAAL